MQDVLAFASAGIAPDSSRAMVRQQIETVAVMRRYGGEGAFVVDSNAFHSFVSELVLTSFPAECAHVTHLQS